MMAVQTTPTTKTTWLPPLLQQSFVTFQNFFQSLQQKLEMAPSATENADTKEEFLSSRSWYFLLTVMRDLHEKDAETYSFVWCDDVRSNEFAVAASKLRNIFGIRKNAATLLLKCSSISSMDRCMSKLDSLQSCPVFSISQIFRDRFSTAVHGGSFSFEVINSLIVRKTSQLHDNQWGRDKVFVWLQLFFNGLVGISLFLSSFQWLRLQVCSVVHLMRKKAFLSIFYLFSSKLNDLCTKSVSDMEEQFLKKEIQVRRDTRSRLRALGLCKEGWDISVSVFRDGIVDVVQQFKSNYYQTQGRRKIRNLRPEDLIGWPQLQLKAGAWVRSIVLHLFYGSYLMTIASTTSKPLNNYSTIA